MAPSASLLLIWACLSHPFNLEGVCPKRVSNAAAFVSWDVKNLRLYWTNPSETQSPSIMAGGKIRDVSVLWHWTSYITVLMQVSTQYNPLSLLFYTAVEYSGGVWSSLRKPFNFLNPVLFLPSCQELFPVFQKLKVSLIQIVIYLCIPLPAYS